MLLATGCVTPPKGTTTSSSASGSYYATETNAGETPTSPSYVAAATPFETTNAGVQGNSPGSNPYSTPTPIPTDQSCLIYLNTQPFSYNTTAISFDLKNPPMYINYTVIPTNITVTKYVKSNQGGNNWVTLQYSDYDPNSWFQVTVLDKTTGTIYNQAGFGKAPGMSNLSLYTSATMGPILNSGNLQIQMTGNEITATTGVWVKPLGNFDDPQNQTFPECKFWGGTQQNYLSYPTTTATPTWTPVNVQTQGY
ncbi:MAG TPA: hypothetical protein VMS83_02480 [Methanoregula sp.]|nr:hypothetical protein [Methanoregula sp.]